MREPRGQGTGRAGQQSSVLHCVAEMLRGLGHLAFPSSLSRNVNQWVRRICKEAQSRESRRDPASLRTLQEGRKEGRLLGIGV